MMSLTFGLFTQVSGSGPLGPLVKMDGWMQGRTLCHIYFCLLFRWESTFQGKNLLLENFQSFRSKFFPLRVGSSWKGFIIQGK